MKYSQYILKRRIEAVFIFPFILTGRLIAIYKPLKKEYQTFFFFPFYHTGGAEKVHAMVAQATGNSNCIIYFTRKSHDQNFYNEFAKSKCVIKDISTYTDNKFLYFMNLIYRGIITGRINKQSLKPIVFNGQCNFGYKISPWVRKDIPQIELIHSFNTFSWIRLPFLPFLTQSIMISKVRIADHLKQYDQLKVAEEYKGRIKYIINGVPLPKTTVPKSFDETINVLYVGRGTEEKRVHLVAQIAAGAAVKQLPVQFNFMGDVKEAIPLNLLPYCNLLGHKTNTDEIDSAYNKAHIVIITSSTEGFPLAIEEGLARACVVIATPVGDIPVHVKNDENGFLFTTVSNTERIVEEGVEYLTLLTNNRNLLKEMSDKNRQYAFEHFSIETFNKQYQQLFNQLRNE